MANPNSEIHIFVPGRLCLFGEHSDWAGKYASQNADIPTGQAIVTGINLGIYARVQKSDRFEIIAIDPDGKQIEDCCEMHLSILRQKALEPSFFNYCYGVAACMRENYKAGGIRIIIDKVTLPMKKGLSSSAAICVLVARAFNRIYNLHLSTRGEMMIAYQGERLTRSRCGRLDQACAYGEKPVLMEFSDDSLNVKKITVGSTLNWVFVDLNAGKNTRRILTALNSCYPYAQNEIASRVQEALGKDNQEIIAQALHLIQQGNAPELGKLMTKAQLLFDTKVAPACPDELTSPVLHSVLSDPNIQQWIYGGKGVGSQGDGSAQFLAKDPQSQSALVDYLNNVRKMQAFSFDIRAGGKVRKAIIPIAGNGTRMFPETHFIKKAFLPVIDKNNIVKPVLLSLLEELDDAEIEEFIIIVGDGEAQEYRNIFSYDANKAFEKKLPENVRNYYAKIRAFGERIVFVEQKEKRGFGHAVYQARAYLGDEPALLTLGDFVYSSNEDQCCAAQLVNAYNTSGGKPVIGIKTVPLDKVRHYGIISGQFYTPTSNLMHVDEMVEKPTSAYAEEHLSVIRYGRRQYFATFGQYVLTNDIFQMLEQQIARSDAEGDSAEIDLTQCFHKMAKKDNLAAIEINGESYDVGIPDQYYNTFVQFRNSK